MDSAMIQRMIIAAMFGLVLGLISYWSIRLGLRGREKDGRKVYASFSCYGALPFVLLILGAMSRLMLGDEADPMLFTSLFSVAVSLTVYYVLLALLMPWLRRRISSSRFSSSSVPSVFSPSRTHSRSPCSASVSASCR